jgi:hypothetical protein
VNDTTDATSDAQRTRAEQAARYQAWYDAPTAAVHTVETTAPAGPPGVPPVKRHRRKTPWGLIILVPFAVIAVLVLALVIVGLIVGTPAPKRAAAPAPPTYNAAPSTPAPGATTTAPSVASTTKAAAPLAPPTTKAAPPPAPAVIVIPDGTWTIGEDYPAGTYRALAVPGTCYWEITKSGTNGADLLANGDGPGNLRVVLKAGQDFNSRECGSWVKQ